MSVRFTPLGALASLSALFLSGPAAAQSDAWARLAEDDLKAARAFIEETHPGAVAAHGDTLFQEQLRRGYDDALSTARTARSFGGYRAALQRFAAAFDDPHLSTNSWVQPDRHWPGFLVSNSSGAWKVTASAAERAPPVGAELVSCDGGSPDELAAKRLRPFTSAWDVRAQRVRASSALLLDSGNPHQPRLSACDFRAGSGETVTHRLEWRPIGMAELSRQFEKAARSISQDVWVREKHGGWWLRLGTLSQPAIAAMKEAAARQAELRASPYIVVDLRGNGGGASFFSDRIAESIYGAGRVDAARRPKGVAGPELVTWRASPVTLTTAEAYVERVARILTSDDPGTRGMVAQRDAIRAALASGAPLATAPLLVGENHGLRAKDVVKRPPRVFLVTDRTCFSSCLMAVRLFRDLGAVHVGEETNANTAYSNLETVELPSGLSTFSSLQSVSNFYPRQIGPFKPHEPLAAELADDAAVEAEMLKLIARKPARR
jgi:hypothetical protein